MSLFSFNTFTIFLIGDSGAGKTTFISRLYNSGVFVENIDPSAGTTKTILTFITNEDRPITFIVVEYAGRDKYNKITHPFSFYDGGIIMFDVHGKYIFDGIKFWKERFSYFLKYNIPVYLCGNKMDTDSQKFMSVKNGNNIRDPFLFLARKLTKNENLIFV